MGQFLRFQVSDAARVEALWVLLAQVSRIKKTGQTRPDEEWAEYCPSEVRKNFPWPDPRFIDLINVAVLDFPKPGFANLVRSIVDGGYELGSFERVGTEQAEIRITPIEGDYLGFTPLIQLVEGFGLPVVGVNELGWYESREQMFASDKTPASRTIRSS